MHERASSRHPAQPARVEMSPSQAACQQALGALCFAAPMGSQPPAGADIPCLCVPMTRVDTAEPICEIWSGQREAKPGRQGDIHYRHDDGVLFGVIALSEAQFAPQPDSTPLQQATDSAYRQIFSLLEALDYPYLFRFWNYIADINTHSHGLERYWQFNLGRQEAFLAHGREGSKPQPGMSISGL